MLNHWYGRDDLLVGAYDINTPGATLEQELPLPYVSKLVTHWPSPIKNTSEVPCAVQVYRRALASQPDQSVTISSIGIHTNLASLLRSALGWNLFVWKYLLCTENLATVNTR